MCTYMYLIVYYEITAQINYFSLFYSLACDVEKRVVDIFSDLDHRKDSLHFRYLKSDLGGKFRQVISRIL